MNFSIKDSKPSDRYKNGKYKLKNKHKYIGLEEDIQYRSSYELEAYIIFDTNPDVIRWIAESDKIKIPYVSSVDKAIHHYFPDAYAEIESNKNGVIKYVIEIKPDSFTKRPKEPIPPVSKSVKRTYNRKLRTYINIMDKRKAAEEWCASRGFKYKIISESFLEKYR